MKKIEKDKLTLKQRLFCKYYIEENGNATEAVVRAGYNVSKKNGISNRSLAKSIGSENLTKPDISKYIQELIEDTGLNDVIVNKHWLFSVTQFADLSVKIKAIDMYNKLKGRYLPEKQEAKPTIVQVVQYGSQEDKNGNSCFPEKNNTISDK